MPRITSTFFRFLLPSHDGGLAFTLAAFLQWVTQIREISRAKSSRRDILIRVNVISFVASCVLVVIGRVAHGDMIKCLNAAVIIGVGVVGWVEAGKN